MGLHRYYASGIVSSDIVQLSEEESHHAIRVRREEIGNLCIVFDGTGYEADAKIVAIDRHRVTVERTSLRFTPRDLDGSLTLGIAMPKGDRQKDVIEKLVELGVHRLIPIQSHRSVVVVSSNHIEKWQRYAIEACKQCERNRTLRIENPISWSAWIDLRTSLDNNRWWIAHPSTSSAIYRPTETRVESIHVAIGPEGGFTDNEIREALDRDWSLLNLGERILRVETAASVASVLAGQHLSRGFNVAE